MDVDESSDLLYDLTQNCFDVLAGLAAQLDTRKSEYYDLIVDYHSRLSEWAAAHGVKATRSHSLDARLRNHPGVHNVVARALDFLWRCLQHLDANLLAASEERPPELKPFTSVETAFKSLGGLSGMIHRTVQARVKPREHKTATRASPRAFSDAALLVLQTLYPTSHQVLREYLCNTIRDRYSVISLT